MNPIDIAVIVCVSVFAAGVIAYLVYRKVKHKDKGCCGSCSECGMCAHAERKKKDAVAEAKDNAIPKCPHCK